MRGPTRARPRKGHHSRIMLLDEQTVGADPQSGDRMTDTTQRVGLLTFIAWALDGYLKVFWRDAPLWQLWPQVLVLTALGTTFLLVARMLARRWELA
jgi:ABC-2 type transport system permease protein